jgi:hypothetical protein
MEMAKLLNIFLFQNSDVIRSCDAVEEIVKPSDLGSKFKFFEEGGADKKSEKKAFRITPPRETKVKVNIRGQSVI